MSFWLFILRNILSWTKLSGLSWMRFLESFNNCSEILWMSMNNWTLTNIWCMVMFQIASWSWSNFKWILFITILLKIISDRTFILDCFRFILRVKCSWNMFSSWNSWISNTSLNSLFIRITSWTYNFVCECFNKILSTNRFAIFPVYSTSWWLCHSFWRLIYIILAWSKSTSIISESCNFCNKNTFNRAIRLLNNIIVIIKIISTSILIFLI